MRQLEGKNEREIKCDFDEYTYVILSQYFCKIIKIYIYICKKTVYCHCVHFCINFIFAAGYTLIEQR